MIQLTISTLTNLVKISRNAYPEMARGIEKLTLGIERLKEAYDELNDSASKFNATSSNNQKWEINKGFKLPENRFGNVVKFIAGGDRLNLDNFARKPLQNLEIWAKTGLRDFGAATGWQWLENHYDNRLNNLNFRTLAEKEQDDFKIGSSEITNKTNQIILENNKALKAAAEITKLDAEITKIQSQRLDLLPQDKEDLKAYLEAEKSIQKQRDKLLKVLTQQQQNLQLAISINKSNLEKLEENYLGQNKDDDFYPQQKALFEGNIEEAEKNLKALNNIISRLPKALSEFERRLRNGNERVSGFMENRDRVLQQERTQIITQGLAEGKGERAIQLELEQLETKDLSLRIDELSKEIAKITRRVEILDYELFVLLEGHFFPDYPVLLLASD